LIESCVDKALSSCLSFWYFLEKLFRSCSWSFLFAKFTVMIQIYFKCKWRKLLMNLKYLQRNMCNRYWSMNFTKTITMLCTLICSYCFNFVFHLFKALTYCMFSKKNVACIWILSYNIMLQFTEFGKGILDILLWLKQSLP
jgi:hypothetical protein